MKNISRWTRLCAGTIMLLSLGTLYAWSVFRIHISVNFPTWTAADLSLNFTISIIFFCLGGFWGGKLSSRLSCQNVARLAAVLNLIGMLGVSFLAVSPNAALLQLYICYGGLCGFGTGLGYNSILAGTNRWFPDRLGLASGILLMGFGGGSFLIGQISNSLSTAFGFQFTFRVLAIAIAVVLSLGSFLIRAPGASDILPPGPPAKKSFSAQEYTTGEMVKQPDFWLLFLWNICVSSTGLLVINSAANIAVAFGLAAALGLLISVLNGLGRLMIGGIVDGLGRLPTMFLLSGAGILSGALMLLGDMSSLSVSVLSGMLIAGACYGGGITVSSAVVSERYGNRHYALNLSVLNFCMIPASIVGPLISGALQDRSGGSFTSTFLMVCVFGCCAMLFGILFKLRVTSAQRTKT